MRTCLLTLAVLLLSAGASAYEGVVDKTEKAPPPKAPTLTRAPELVTFVEAAFPEEAAKAGLAGEVGLVVDIGADGKVTDASVVAPAGNGFDEAALAAVKQFIFTAAELDGVPAPVRIGYTYRFVQRVVAPAPVASDAAPAAPEAIVGRIIERASRKPIVGANVHCDETGEDVLTDSDGRFALHLLPGTYQVRVSAGGYHPFHREEIVEEDKQLDVTYHLMPQAYGLFQTVVRASRDKREATQRTLARDELQRIPGTMGDPIRVVQNMPGVARAPYLGGQIIVRGASPQETGSYLDSIAIPQLYHFMGGPSVVNPEFLDRLDFLPGGFGPRYGRAIGGIIDAFTRRGAVDTVHGNLKTDFIDTALFLEGPVGDKVSLAGAVRRSYIDQLLPYFMPNDEDGSLSVLPVYWDYQVRGDYGKKSDAHQFTLMAFGSDDRLTVAQKGGDQNLDLQANAHVNFHRLRGGWLWRGGDLTNGLMLFFGRTETGMELANEGASFGGGGAMWAGGLRDELNYDLGGGSSVRLGADVLFTRADATMKVPITIPTYRPFPGADLGGEPETISRLYHQSAWSLYNDWELKVTDRLTLLPGLRVEEFHYAGRNVPATDPRLIARYRMLDQTPLGVSTTLKGSLGHYSMAPQPMNADDEYGNPDLALEKAFQSSLGLEHKITDAIDLDVTGFYNRRYDLVIRSTKVLTREDGTIRPEYANNDGLGRAYGVELLLRHNLTEHFFGWIAYTLSRTEERKRGDPNYVAGSYDEPHILTAVAQYRFGNGWSVGGRFRLVSGRPFTPYSGASYDGDANRYTPVFAEARSGRNPLFHQLDLRVDREWLFDLWKFGVYVDVQNVYNASNIEMWQWDYRYRERVGIPGIPLLPTLGIKGSF